MRRLNGKKLLSVFLLLILLLLLSGAGYFADHFQLSCTMEAGEELTPKMLWTGFGQADFAENAGIVDILSPGVYETQLQLWGRITLPATVTVQDTQAPLLTCKKVTLKYGESCEASDFVESCDDATQVTLSWAEPPDFERLGTQQVGIIAQDMGGNIARTEAELFIPGVRESVEVELGEEIPPAEAFLIESDAQATYLSDLSGLDIYKAGVHDVQISVDGTAYTTQLVFVDTRPPVAVVEPKSGWVNKEMAPEDFVVSVEDLSEVAIAYGSTPDWRQEGEQKVAISFTDESGNQTVCETVLTLEVDRVAPVISANDITVKVEQTISYKKSITLSDNCDRPEEIKLEVDSGAVDLKTAGNYPVHIVATDRSGNRAEKSITVRVVAADVVTYDQATIDQMADEVLAKILREGMSQQEKAQAIYNWVHSNVSYINHSDKSNWLRGAYEGFKLHKGDCFVYYSTSRALLTRAGIPNLEIKKEKTPATSQSNHYWNLVDVGSGWYHFDTTPRKDKTVFFLWTDEQLRAYSDSHKGSHNFTRELYPAIN